MQTPTILSFDKKPYTIYKYHSLDSTNTFLKSDISSFADFAVIWTDNQTSGRGRYTRTWSSAENKDITFSILLPLTSLATTLWQNIPQISALAITEILAEYGISATIKWPNDILVNGKKICGILCETATGAERPCAILGIGLNANSTPSQHSEITQPATSLCQELHHPIQREELLVRLLDAIISSFLKFTTRGFTPFRDKISAILMYKNEVITILDGARKYTGKLLGINSDGTLLLHPENGPDITVHAGEVTFHLE